MGVSWVQSINPVFIIILAGVFAALWTKLGERQPSTPIKFALGTMIMGVAFLLFLPFAGGGPNSTPLIGLIGILFVFTIAELLISPVGLSLSTKLAPEAFHTQMVALFFLSIALRTAMSGVLAGCYNPDSETAYFGILGAVAIGIGVVLRLYPERLAGQTLLVGLLITGALLAVSALLIIPRWSYRPPEEETTSCNEPGRDHD